jgi:CBS domain containing-hemolysin-like protein
MIEMLAVATSAASKPDEFVVVGGAGISWQLWLLYIAAFAALIAAAVFSGCEIGLYSLSKVRLRLRIARKEPNAILIAEWFERPTYALEGLLIWQNIAGFIFTAIITAILSLWGFGEMGQSVISTAFVLPMMLIFTEIMPKDLFHTHADRWMYRMVPMLKWLFRTITVVPLLPLVNALSRMSMWMVGANKNVPMPTGPRTEILTLFEESAATGVLTGTQQDLVQRALRLGRTSVREVMIPWNRVIGVPVGISHEGFRAMVKRYHVSRMPVLGNSMTEVMGIVDVLDALVPRTAGTFRMADYVHPPMTLIGEQSVRSAITLMQRARQTIAIVMDRHGRSIGLVTMKDLIEELVGDLENW